jgi:HAD superfamily, subfamily IIIB (Acid phosphatase)
VGDAKAAALAYYNSGTYQRDLEAVANQAVSWVNTRAALVKQPALVLDIDETALSNWEILKRDDLAVPLVVLVRRRLTRPVAGLRGTYWDATQQSHRHCKFFSGLAL